MQFLQIPQKNFYQPLKWLRLTLNAYQLFHSPIGVCFFNENLARSGYGGINRICENSLYNLIFILMVDLKVTPFILLAFIVAYNVVDVDPAPSIIYSQYEYHVHCPVFYDPSSELKDLISEEEDANLRKDYDERLKRTYVVRVRAIQGPNPKIGEEDEQVVFCAFARPWLGSCDDPSQVKEICSVPGPVFDLDVKEEIYVFWVNQVEKLNPEFTNLQAYSDVNACYQDEDVPERCYVEAKTQDWEECTYKDPTSLGKGSYKRVKIGKDNFPTSVHVHGLQVRPAYDGNPYSWFSQSSVGVGFLSAEQSYFDNIGEEKREELYEMFGEEVPVKLNIYPNDQLPGTLWYHDHSMATTGFSNLKGLNGMYILRDREVEKDLPSAEYQSILMLHTDDEQTVMEKRKVFKTDTYYRLRVLINHYSKPYANLRFLDPNNETIDFSVIGQDSTLMQKPSHGVTFMDMASGERSDILIKFPSERLPAGSQVSIVYDPNAQFDVIIDKNKTIIKLDIGEVETDETRLNWQPPQSLDVSFTNLTQIEPQRKRMRPLFMNGMKFNINAHGRHHHPDSENPKIGEVQDWTFVNLIPILAHPIHIHLITYQMVKDYELKFVRDGLALCMYYELDFFLKYASDECVPAQLRQKYNLNTMTFQDYQSFCKQVKLLTLFQFESCFEGHKNEREFINGVSGIDVEEESEQASTVFVDNVKFMPCQESNYKYICRESDIPEYKRGWKEVGLTKEGHALTIRIRWTKTDYDPQRDGTQYFNIDEADLVQFPGYVYHCHFLNHEDNEMMRPIMVQHSDAYMEEVNGAEHWDTKYEKVNEELGCQAVEEMHHGEYEEEGEEGEGQAPELPDPAAVIAGIAELINGLP